MRQALQKIRDGFKAFLTPAEPARRSLAVEALESRHTPAVIMTGEFDGLPGTDTATINGVNVRITSGGTGVSHNYVLPSAWNVGQRVELDGQPGEELLFTNLTTINGIAVPAKASVLTARTGTVRGYDIGKANSMQVLDLDGQPGNEVLFTNLLSVNGIGQPGQASVLTQRTQEVTTYQVSKANLMQVVDLDGQPGSELLFTNLLTINGFGQPAQATVVNHRTRQAPTYQVGSPNRMQIAELDGQPGNDLLFTNLVSVNGFGQPAQATVMAPRTGDLRSYAVGGANAMQLAELDGQPGNELVFTNMVSINGIGQPSRATVVNPRTHLMQSYDAGRANRLQLVDLDGQPGSEMLFTNLLTINGFGQPVQATVITPRTGPAKTYDVGSPSSMMVAELDGAPGQELIFASGTSISVLTHRTQEFTTYQTGRWNSFYVADFDGVAGDEIRVSLANGKLLTINHRLRRMS